MSAYYLREWSSLEPVMFLGIIHGLRPGKQFSKLTVTQKFLTVAFVLSAAILFKLTASLA